MVAVSTALVLGATVQAAGAIDAHHTASKAAKEQKRFTAQAKEDAQEERVNQIDAQRLQLGSSPDNKYKTKQTTGYSGLVGQGETLG